MSFLVSPQAAKYVLVSIILLSVVVKIIRYSTLDSEWPFLPHVGRQHCTWMKYKTNTSRKNENPPWFSLLADHDATVRSGRNLYVWANGAHFLRLGNRLFNYAATFGIAWHNRRIPIWPKNRASMQFDITKFFSLRIPADYNDIITRVRSLFCYC